MKIRTLLPLLFFAFIAFSLWQALSQHPNEISSPLIGKAAPAFTLPTLADATKPTTEKDFQGHITFLTVWATWCSTCVAEHEYMKELARNNDIMLYGYIYKDDPKTVQTWLNEHGNPYKIVALDESGLNAINWGVYGTPETFIIDKHGIIRGKQVGALTPDVWDEKLQPLVMKLRTEA